MRGRRVALGCALVVAAGTAIANVIVAGPHITIGPPAVAVIATGSGAVTAHNDGDESVAVTGISQDAACATWDGTALAATFDNFANNMFTFPSNTDQPISITCPGAGPSTSSHGIRRCKFAVDTQVPAGQPQLTGICLYQTVMSLGVNPPSLTFPTTPVGGSSSLPLTITPQAAVGGFYFSIDDQAENFVVSAPCAGVHCLDPVPVAGGVGRAATITCAPKTAGTHSARLFIVADTGESAVPVLLSCNGAPAGDGDINLSQQTVTMSRHVGSPDMATVTMQNAGTGNLVINSIQQSGSPDWAYTVSAPCDVMPCTLQPTDMVLIQVVFSPTSIGSIAGSLVINSNDPDEGMQTLMLDGTGEGTTLTLVSAVSPPVSIGISPIGTPISRTITVANQPATESLPVTADVMPQSVFTLVPASATIPMNQTQDITITCTPQAAVTETSTFTVSGMQTLGSDISFPIECTGTNGNLSVSPGRIDLGDVRTDGMGPRVVGTVMLSTNGPTLTIQNGPAEQPDVTAVSVGAPSSNSIVMGTPVSFDVSLDPTTDGPISTRIDLAAGADMASIDFTANVVTAKLDDPPAVDFGTLCIGKPVPAPHAVTLHSSGTAKIHMQSRPDLVMPISPFALEWVQPAQNSYPYDLPAGTDATVRVAPKSQTMPGTYTDMIAWTTDTPVQTKTRVEADWVADGGGVSPGALDFGMVPVKQSALAQTVTVQNCSAGDLTLSQPTFEPAGEFVATDALPETLSAGASATVTVTFAPARGGARRATMTVETSAGPLAVELTGTGLGDDGAGGSPASLYACDCSSGSPASGLVIMLALALPLVPRRRR